jgi:hypothetical protein
MATDKLLLELAADMRDLRKEVKGDRAHNAEMFDQVIKSLADMTASLKDLHVTTSSLASATGLAMSDLAVAVFPPKH